MSGNDDCLNEEIINLGGARSRGTVEYEDYGDEDGQEEHLVLQWDEHICSNLSSSSAAAIRLSWICFGVDSFLFSLPLKI